MSVKLSVIIVNYNVKLFLEQCLNSVLASSMIADTEIIVVDNASTDGSREYLPPLFPQVKFVLSPENLGFAKANNRAIKQAQGDYVLLLNPDTLIGTDTLVHVCRFMDEHPDAGALGVQMLDETGAYLPESKRGFPTLWVSLCKLLGFNGRYHLTHLDKDQVHEVDVLAGACMLMRKEVVQATGGFDEAFFMYWEDTDLAWRIKQAGYKNYYVPEKIVHYKGKSSKQDAYRYVRVFYDGMWIFYKKHNPNQRRLSLWGLKLGVWSFRSLSLFRVWLRNIFISLCDRRNAF
ncbi:MAG: glycosyltransferase family 2 protein [Candidatus Symbiothrix sp.]|jgi:GT2 family glycosyltransferase|nr:glycosyltransferase family 2 protein [Candidatus Symbiothrix sp.]